MKNGLLASIATAGFTLAFAASAFAADLDQRPESLAMRPLWTGFYLGGFAGGAFGGNATAHDPVSTAPPFIGGYSGANPNTFGLGTSLTGGMTVGYNYWFRPGFVAGLEAEAGYLHLRASNAYTGGISNGMLTATAQDGDWYSILGGRFGYAAGQTLFYVKGGAAVLTEKASAIQSNVIPGVTQGLLNATGQSTVWGAAVGGGVEWMFAPNWSVKTEYMYLDLSNSVQACGVNTGSGSQGVGATFCSNVNFPAVQTGKIGLNYRF